MRFSLHIIPQQNENQNNELIELTTNIPLQDTLSG